MVDNGSTKVLSLQLSKVIKPTVRLASFSSTMPSQPILIIANLGLSLLKQLGSTGLMLSAEYKSLLLSSLV